jgi:hypothetical protein
MMVTIMNEIVIHQLIYFVPKGRCKKILMLINRCYAKNQMWQFKRKRRQQFLAKAVPYITSKIRVIVKQQGYLKWKIEFSGSTNMYDVDAMRKQSYRIYMMNPHTEKTLQVAPTGDGVSMRNSIII